MKRALGVAGAVLVACVSAAPSFSVGAEPVASLVGSSGIPVVGSISIAGGRAADMGHAQVLVNGLRRIPGATVLYFSIGLKTASPSVTWNSLMNLPPDRRWSLNGAGSVLGSAVLIDMGGKRTYSVLIDAQQRALASPTSAWPDRVGSFYSFYEVLPELPAGLTKVDVQIGNNDVVHDVPVGTGILEPAVEQTGPLELGHGWPMIDLAAAANSFQPEESIRQLHTRTSDLKETVVQREAPDSVTVDLSSDVLFGFDSARLGSLAQEKIRATAEKINERSDGGRIHVIGYTDNIGSSAYGIVLSKQRAQAVAEILKSLVTVPGVTYTIEGRGERDPVASNDTDAGRKQNRRVSVTFTPKTAEKS